MDTYKVNWLDQQSEVSELLPNFKRVVGVCVEVPVGDSRGGEGVSRMGGAMAYCW